MQAGCKEESLEAGVRLAGLLAAQRESSPLATLADLDEITSA